MEKRGSPNFPKERTFLLTVDFIDQSKLSKTATKKHARHAKIYTNPIFTARKYAEMISSGLVASEAALARKIGVSRARINQIMLLLKLDKEVVAVVESFGAKTSKRLISERMLRRLLQSPTARADFLGKYAKN